MTVTSGPRGADPTCEQVIGLMADYLESAFTPEGIAEPEALDKLLSKANRER